MPQKSFPPNLHDVHGAWVDVQLGWLCVCVCKLDCVRLCVSVWIIHPSLFQHLTCQGLDYAETLQLSNNHPVSKFPFAVNKLSIRNAASDVLWHWGKKDCQQLEIFMPQQDICPMSKRLSSLLINNFSPARLYDPAAPPQPAPPPSPQRHWALVLQRQGKLHLSTKMARGLLIWKAGIDKSTRRLLKKHSMLAHTHTYTHTDTLTHTHTHTHMHTEFVILYRFGDFVWSCYSICTLAYFTYGNETGIYSYFWK